MSILTKRNILIIFSVFIFSFSSAQRVGLVLCGGGSKGLAHIGLIQALEDNNTPIDSITGTSIGTIVGWLYDLGFSPEDMLEFV